MAILEEYQNRENKVGDIAARYGIGRKDVTHIVIEQGGEPRRPNAIGKRGGDKQKTCPHCRRRIAVQDAIYCCYCGGDMRSKRDLLVERAKRACGLIQFLPNNARDEMQQLLLDVIKELKE